MRRVLGLFMIIIGVLGIVLSIFGIIFGNQLVDTIGDSLRTNLTLTLQSLETVQDTLLVTRETLVDVNDSLVTLETTADDAAETINNLRPLMNQVSTVASDEVPASLETIQETIPSLVQVATAIDDALSTLNRFRALGIGIEYEPEVPFGESVSMLGGSLEGLPEQLRTLDVYLTITDDNLRTISQDISLMADDLQGINSNFGEFVPLLDDYMATVTDVMDSTRETRATLDQQLVLVKIVLTILMAWLGLTQIAPLYLGYELLRGTRRPELDVVVIDEDTE